MAGRPKKIRSIQSYINSIDAHTYSGPMKSGLPPSIGVTRNFWYNYSTQCNNNPNQIKKSYANNVFLNINPAQTPVSSGFKPSNNTNYTYNYMYPTSTLKNYNFTSFTGIPRRRF